MNTSTLLLALGILLAGIPKSLLAADSSAVLPDSSAPPVTQRSEHLDSATIKVVGHHHDLDRLGALSEAIQPTSVVTSEAIERKNANDFSQAVTDEPGVSVLTACGSCGFKQIQINGLGANYTTLLIDGIPIYNSVSSFYGVDALTTAGVADIEIARGPGASLLAPGAIGGAMDVRFQDPTRTAFNADVAGGNNDWNRLSFSGTTLTDDGKIGILIAGHHFQQGEWDALGNGVSQSPSLNDNSVLLRLNGSLGEDWTWNLRYTYSFSQIFGGPITDNYFGAIEGGGVTNTNTTPVFAGNNVEGAYLGAPVDIVEWVQTGRNDAAGALTWDSPDLGLWQLKIGLADQTQTSDYEGGTDYHNQDQSGVSDLRWQGTAGPNTLTLGGDGNIEQMGSESVLFSANPDDTLDAFHFLWGGAYAQDVWNFGHDRDLSVALRADKIYVNWVDKQNSKINDFIAAPRASLRWEFFEGLTGRLSAGEGWRAPLTFFEEDHGLLGGTNGFDIDVTNLETAYGAGGSLSWDKPRWTATVGAYGTDVTHLAYINDPGEGVTPTLENLPGTLPFLDVDAEGSVLPLSWAKLGLGVEHYQIPDRYKAVEPIAAVETQLNGLVDLNYGPASLHGDGSWIAPRNLLPYGYGQQYNVYDFTTNTPSDPKLTHAPAYFLINAKATWSLRKELDVYAGGDNLLNYTQAGSAHDNTDYWDAQGNFNTSHIWGPLRGRQLYIGLSWKS